ncbi:uncharacterized protein LOC110913221 [Helianthus annuus]|uniref:uncharacterized protein LOC110913221 n=1 Tax=Helianthus annuus TaxID=4232 RepID=UPI000B8F7A3F|nr:uncharacterized protein LOC110913221 [Helianthus annuus]
MNLLTVNIRGIGGTEKPLWLSRLVKEQKASFLCIQETQISDIDAVIVGRYWGQVDMEWVSVDARGRSGGLVSAWDPGAFSKRSVIKNESFLAVTGRIFGTEVVLNIVNVYALCETTRRRILWEELKRIKVEKEGMWVMAGDFNEVREEEDMMISRFDSHSALIFNTFIAEAGMMEYQMGGYKFTYMPDDGSSLSKIDRILWRKEDKSSEEKEMHETMKEVEDIERVAETRRLTTKEKEKRIQGKWKLKKFEKRRVKDLKQKAKMKWTKLGDENSKFFHIGINCRKAKNRINTLWVNGNMETEPKAIKKAVLESFSARFIEPYRRRPTLDGRGFRQLTNDQAKKLIEEFSKEEIKEAVWACGSDMALGPDGFSFKFIKRFGAQLEKQFVGVLKDFHKKAHIEGGCNPSFIALIPKTKDPKSVSEFRPI